MGLSRRGWWSLGTAAMALFITTRRDGSRRFAKAEGAKAA